MLTEGAVTLAVICWKLLGVLKPPGGRTVISEVPAFIGSNWVVSTPSPFAKVSGLTVMMPTFVSELVTSTSVW